MPKRICVVDGCERDGDAAGWCRMHYMRIRRHGDPGSAEITCIPAGTSAADRFRLIGWDVTPSGCWEWRGGRYKTGYGALTIQVRTMGYAHRVSYEIHRGAIPVGMLVCHHCDNPPCVNPDHLFLGTSADNVRDMWRKGRQVNPFGRSA